MRWIYNRERKIKWYLSIHMGPFLLIKTWQTAMDQSSGDCDTSVRMHLLTVPAPAYIKRQFPALITLTYLFYQPNPVKTHWQQLNTVRSDAVTLALLMIDNAADRPALHSQPKESFTRL